VICSVRACDIVFFRAATDPLRAFIGRPLSANFSFPNSAIRAGHKTPIFKFIPQQTPPLWDSHPNRLSLRNWGDSSAAMPL